MRKEDVVVIGINSKDYINLLKKFIIWEDKKTYSIRLKNKLRYYSENFLCGFSRGLIDTEGFVEISNVSCDCTSEKLIEI